MTAALEQPVQSTGFTEPEPSREPNWRTLGSGLLFFVLNTGALVHNIAKAQMNGSTYAWMIGQAILGLAAAATIATSLRTKATVQGGVIGFLVFVMVGGSAMAWALREDLLACNDAEVRKAVRELITDRFSEAANGIDVLSAGELVYDGGENARRTCRAQVRHGQQDTFITFELSWQDKSSGLFFVQIEPEEMMKLAIRL